MVDITPLFISLFDFIQQVLNCQFSIGGISWTVGNWLLACCVFGLMLWLIRWLAEVNDAH